MHLPYYLMLTLALLSACNSKKAPKSAIKNSPETVEKIAPDPIILSDTTAVIRITDSLLKTAHFTPPVYKINALMNLTESEIDETWGFDRNNEVVAFESKWKGEGYSGHNLHYFRDQKLIAVNDTTYEGDQLLEVKRMFYRDQNHTGYTLENIYRYNTETESVEHKGQKIKLTGSEDLKAEETFYRKSIEDILGVLLNPKARITYKNGVAQITYTRKEVSGNTAYNDSYLIKMDSVFLERIKKREVKLPD